MAGSWPTDLLQAQKIAADVTGYCHPNKGAAAELDYWYVVVKHQHDLLRHYERALAGEVEFDLRRTHEVLAEFQSLAVERLGGTKHRAYVIAEKPAGETDETAAVHSQEVSCAGGCRGGEGGRVGGRAGIAQSCAACACVVARAPPAWVA